MVSLLRLGLLVLIAFTGCVTGDTEPELTESERYIKERRQRHGLETEFSRQDRDGETWRYSSESDNWSRTR